MRRFSMHVQMRETLDTEERTREIRVNFLPVEGGRHQPEVSISDTKTGLDVQLKLPAMQCNKLGELIEKLDPLEAENFVRKMIAFLILLK